MTTLQLRATFVEASPTTVQFDDRGTFTAIQSAPTSMPSPDIVQVLDGIYLTMIQSDQYAYVIQEISDIIQKIKDLIADFFLDREAVAAPSISVDREISTHDTLDNPMVICNEVEISSDSTSATEKQAATVLSWRVGAIAQAIEDSMQQSMLNGEVFEHGMNSSLSLLVSEIASEYSAAMVARAARDIIGSSDMDCEAIAEMIKQIGYLEDDYSLAERCSVMTQALSSRSPVIRDAAVLGLFALESISTLPAIEAAISCEDVPEIMRDLKLLQRQLLS